MNDTIPPHVTIPDQFINDIVECACYGIDYWCLSVNSIHKEGEPLAWDFQEIDARRPIHVSIDLMRKTLNDIITGRIDCDEGFRQSVCDALVIPEDVGCYIDAGYADCIVQFACFGEQRYG